MQKAVFYTLKGHLLQPKRRPFANALTVRLLRNGTDLHSKKPVL